jgi:chemotaxis protein histidine kinase CheA
MSNKSNQNEVIKFPDTPSININIGLKHCNKNQALYSKTLNNFVKRYSEIDLVDMEKEDRFRAIHSLKGLTATLGMTVLHEILCKLEVTFENSNITLFLEELQKVSNSICEA